MTRSEAVAPLKSGEGRLKGEAGMLLRGQLRQAAVRNNIDYYEEKTFWSSLFIFRGEARRIQAFKDMLDRALRD